MRKLLVFFGLFSAFTAVSSAGIMASLDGGAPTAAGAGLYRYTYTATLDEQRSRSRRLFRDLRFPWLSAGLHYGSQCELDDRRYRNHRTVSGRAHRQTAPRWSTCCGCTRERTSPHWAGPLLWANSRPFPVRTGSACSRLPALPMEEISISSTQRPAQSRSLPRRVCWRQVSRRCGTEARRRAH